MRHRSGAFGALILFAGASGALAAPAISASSDVTVAVTNLRSDKGQILACLTAKPADFPDCQHDPQAHKLTVPAREPLMLDFGAVPDGRYAISLIHDENSNGKLDTALMIPREGFGFSQDAPVRMGPPRFNRAAFETQGTDTHLKIRMRYLL